MKLIVRVRPGVELTCATLWPSRELIRLDLPTLERPRKANSGGPSGGKNLGSAAEVRNLAMGGFICFCRCAATRLRALHKRKLFNSYGVRFGVQAGLTAGKPYN